MITGCKCDRYLWLLLAIFLVGANGETVLDPLAAGDDASKLASPSLGDDTLVRVSRGADLLKGNNAYESLRDFATSENEAFIRRRLFNTSVALTVPFFSFTLPNRASEGSTVDLANQAIFGLFSLLVVVLVFTVPILFTGTRPLDITGKSHDQQGILNHLLNSNKVLNFMGADLTNQIGIDSEKCLQKTICEAHRHPDRYGLISLPFRMFFPPPTNGTQDARASSFQLAARDGKYTRKDCSKSYKCFFDVLDLANYFIDWWRYSSDPNYEIVN